MCKLLTIRQFQEVKRSSVWQQLLVIQECLFCKKLLLFDHFEARTRGVDANCGPKFNCEIPNSQIIAVN
ncbi:CLUMA_CG012610, isoform A [Clunio marinus]|uniref:CLUMA_CG012610, isoform A n=1 Tax=Clunio marinus TaxID=568069 RepID=A0A1J1IG72_9DIPT|nr:CLUMA_CG012610, isoform A [Clunio marinus]